ncbi:MAG: M20/M25/M40 family metallo-hydrolase, partial [Peptostreptococcaceae bacterium]
MKSNNKISYILLALVIAISSVIGFNSLYPSKANYDDYTKVNVKNQMEHIKEIAKTPHSIFDKEAHDEVRDYLIKELKELDLEPQIYKYDDVYVERTKTNEDLENIYAEIKGKNDSYIMLVTHYDSSQAKKERYAEEDGSLGAADAGYGLSTILETIRAIKENNVTMNNGIKILITDGEEYGLIGAKEAVKEKEIFENVNYLVNLEARGTKGPAIMFETSPNNAGIVDLYESSEKPFSYSITPEIYRLLPNGTDFTVFLENNIPGINISVLDGLENYHTPNDKFESLNEDSMQHYGDQVLPIVTEFVSNEKYATSDALTSEDDSIFFIIGNVFVKYSKMINYGLLVAILACIVVLFKKFKIKNILAPLKYTLINLGYTVLVAGASYGVSRLAAVINGRPYKITYLPLIKYEYAIILGVIAISIIGYIFLIRKVSNKLKEKNEYVLGSIILLFLLGIVLTIALPGGSYLFVFPALLIGIFTILVS